MKIINHEDLALVSGGCWEGEQDPNGEGDKEPQGVIIIAPF